MNTVAVVVLAFLGLVLFGCVAVRRGIPSETEGQRVKYNFEHAEVCPNKEANRQSWRTERERAKHAEGLLWAALQPVTCPNCKAQDAIFFDDPSLSDPCRVAVWGCKGCNATYSDFPTPEKVS